MCFALPVLKSSKFTLAFLILLKNKLLNLRVNYWTFLLDLLTEPTGTQKDETKMQVMKLIELKTNKLQSWL